MTAIIGVVLYRLERELVAWRDRAVRIERERSRMAREVAWWRNEYPLRDHGHETARTTWIPRPPYSQ